MDFDTMRECQGRLMECIKAADLLQSLLDNVEGHECVAAVAPQVEGDIRSAMMQAREDAWRYLLFLCPAISENEGVVDGLFSLGRADVLERVNRSVESFCDTDEQSLFCIDGPVRP